MSVVRRESFYSPFILWLVLQIQAAFNELHTAFDMTQGQFLASSSCCYWVLVPYSYHARWPRCMQIGSQQNLADWLIDFNGISTRQGLFQAKMLENRVHCTFIYTFFGLLFHKRFLFYIIYLFLHMILSNKNIYYTDLFDLLAQW